MVRSTSSASSYGGAASAEADTVGPSPSPEGDTDRIFSGEDLILAHILSSDGSRMGGGPDFHRKVVRLGMRLIKLLVDNVYTVSLSTDFRLSAHAQANVATVQAIAPKLEALRRKLVAAVRTSGAGGVAVRTSEDASARAHGGRGASALSA